MVTSNEVWLTAFDDNNTYELVDAPTNNSEIVDCRWVFKVKHNVDGTVKFKARLIARGFSQRYGEILIKNLYCLKQAGNECNKRINTFLVDEMKLTRL